MNICVIGTGYVGLVTGTCFSELGNDVTCIDNNHEKVKQLKSGHVPIYEPGLDDLIHRNVKEGRLQFTTNLNVVTEASVIFLALPTPPGEDGSADLSYILGVANDLGDILKPNHNFKVIVNKSTVPVGTVKKVKDAISAKTKAKFDVVSNPEFLREGQAVNDFMNPDRVVIGAVNNEAKEIMRKLYHPLVRRNPSAFMTTDPASAETIKYAANAFLATKISFINSLTAFCEAAGADIEAVREGMGSDTRIGSQFLYPGPGYGGSCFPKDTLALAHMAKEFNVSLDIVDSTIKVNEAQKKRMPKKIKDYYSGNLKGKTFALLGLAFKDNTDDIRESPSLVIINDLIKSGAKIVAFDPQAMNNVKKQYEGIKNLTFSDDEYSAMKGADAVVIATNWKEFYTPDWNKVRKLLNKPVIFDARNLYEPEEMKDRNFTYISLGRSDIIAND